MSSQITALMVAFLLNLQSEQKLNLASAEKILQSPKDHHSLIFKWINCRKWDLYVYMQEALEQFIHLEQQSRANKYTKSLNH